MFGNRRNNFNFDDLMARYEKMMKEFNNLDWKKESDYESPDGSYKYTSYVKVFDLSDIFDGNKSKEMGKAEYLNIKLERAIEMEDFEEAVKLRDQIKSLEKNKEKISELQTKLDECIKKQDFEKAIEYRDKINGLK